MPQIRAVVFDIDGTLYPQWRLLTTSIGFYIRNFYLVQRYWKVRRSLRGEGYHYQAEGRSGLLQHQAQMYADLTGEQAADVESLLNQKIYDAWEKTFKNIKPFPGVKKTLTELKNRGFIVAAMSDFPVERKLQYFDLGSEYWDLAVTSENSGYLKPHRMAYEYLAKELQLQPQEILYAGNSYRNDIVGAQKAGCRAAYFTWKNRRDSVADFHYRSYSQFLNRLDTFLRYE